MLNTSQKIKSTPVGDIPVDWDCVRINNLKHFLTSGSRGWSSFYSDSGSLFLRITNLKRYKISPDLTSLKYVSLPITSNEGRRTKIQAKDILISITADLGIIGYINDDFETDAYVSQHVALLRINEAGIDNEFLAYFLSSYDAEKLFKRLNDAGAKAGLSLGTIRQFPIALPPLPEQRKIAEVLGTWNRAIDTQQQLIDSLTQRKKALMQQLLTGKTRLPGFEEEWQTKRASELFGTRSEKNKDGHPVLSVTQDIGIVTRSSMNRKISGAKANEKNYKVVYPGDFVISLRSFQGGLEYSTILGAVSPAYHVLIKKQEISDDYFRHFFKSYIFIGRLALAVIGIRDGKQISFKDFSFLKFTIPIVAEQKAIAQVLTTADLEIKTHTDHLESLRTQKRGLMQQLLTGKTRVTI